MAVSEVLQVLTAVSLVGGGGRGIGETIHPRGVSRKFGRLILDGHRRFRNFDLLGGIGRMRHAIARGPQALGLLSNGHQA